MTNDWLVTFKFKNMPNDADVDSMRIFSEVMLTNNYDVDVLTDVEIVNIERCKPVNVQTEKGKHGR